MTLPGCGDGGGAILRPGARARPGASTAGAGWRTAGARVQRREKATDVASIRETWRRRSVARALACAGVLLLAGRAAAAVIEGKPPYDQSTTITDFEPDWGTFRRLAPGSDNWPTTWAGTARSTRPGATAAGSAPRA